MDWEMLFWKIALVIVWLFDIILAIVIIPVAGICTLIRGLIFNEWFKDEWAQLVDSFRDAWKYLIEVLAM